MRLFAAFLKLVRLPNLFFIALTQVLFQVCIYEILYSGDTAEKDGINFILLVAASLMIAAAGYIINDYFDINIDEVNKPGKMVVDRHIHRRWAIAWHFILSLTGIVLTVIAVPLDRKWYIILANMLCVILLWFYSTSYKRKLLIGNIMISLLTAWTVMVVFFSKYEISDFITDGGAREQKFFRLALLYAGFAFIISLIREAIKDMEDMPGDAKYGCRTMPIAWGVNATKVYTAVWLVVLIAILALLQVYVSRFGWWLPVAYSAGTIILPLVLVLFKLRSSRTSREFHQLSNITKLVMFSGILSMIFFYFYL
jgi:4-hydroxybenzoate polyprenyltransferase